MYKSIYHLPNPCGGTDKNNLQVLQKPTCKRLEGMTKK